MWISNIDTPSTFPENPAMKKIVALSLLFTAVHAGAAPSVYPIGLTRHDTATATAYNSYVLFSGQDKKTPLIYPPVLSNYLYRAQPVPYN